MDENSGTSISSDRTTYGMDQFLKIIFFQSTSEKDDDSIEQPLSSSLRPPSSVAKPSVTDMSEFTDATITADEFSEEVLKYPRNIGVQGALTSEWKNQNILGDFEVSYFLREQ